MPKQVPELVRKAIGGDLKEPQVAEVVAWWFQIAGGPKQVAKILYDEYIAAKPGSLTRQRILDMILRGTKFANEKNTGRDDLANVSNEDLEREMSELMKEMSNGPA